MTSSKYVALLVVCLALSASCSHLSEERHMASREQRYSMMIATDSSAFKDNVRHMIIEKYQSYCSIDVIDLSRLRDVDVEPYDVVVIMDTCIVCGGFNRSLKSFLGKPENIQKTVLTMTSGNPEWKYDYHGVDAVTSASLPEKRNSFFNRIDRKIKAVLKKN